MSVHDETWNRPICNFCKNEIKYGEKSNHLDGKCNKMETKIKLAVIGSRGFKDRERLYKILDKNIDRIEYIVSGGCQNSPDEMANDWCKSRGKSILIIYPDWNQFQKRAGMIRNEYIIRAADKVLIIWDGKSAGTSNSIEWCKKLNKEHKIIRFDA